MLRSLFRVIFTGMENRLSAVLAAREAEGRQMASLEPDVPEVVSGENVTQGEQPQQPASSVINDKKSDAGVSVPAGGIEQELKQRTGRRDGTATATRDQ
ncbi:hypothetical protein ACLB1Q_35580 [Escherichia coli]